MPYCTDIRCTGSMLSSQQVTTVVTAGATDSYRCIKYDLSLKYHHFACTKQEWQTCRQRQGCDHHAGRVQPRSRLTDKKMHTLPIYLHLIHCYDLQSAHFCVCMTYSLPLFVSAALLLVAGAAPC